MQLQASSRLVIIGLVLAAGAIAQPPIALQMQTPIPAAPTVSTSVVGNTGNAQYSYYVVANYPGGTTTSPVAITRFAPVALSSTNYINIGWGALNGVSTYDVIKLPVGTAFTGSCTCAVATGLTTTSTSDQGGALSGYTLGSPAVTASGTLYVNNTAYNPPELRQVINGVDSAVGGGGGSGCLVPGASGDLIYNMSGACGAALLTTDGTNLNLEGASVFGNATSSTVWKLSSVSANSAGFSPSGGNTAGALFVASAGTSTLSSLRVANTTLANVSANNYGYVTERANGTTATFATNVVGSGTGFTDIDIGDLNVTVNLIHFQSNNDDIATLGLAVNSGYLTLLGSSSGFTIGSFGAGVLQSSSGGVVTSSSALANGTTATTQSPGDNTTKVATDAFVTAAVGTPAFSALTNGTNTTASMLVGTGATLAYTGSGVVNANEINGAIIPASAAPVCSNSSAQIVNCTVTGTGTTVVLSASPALTGTPTVPTAATGTSTTQAASTAFVANSIPSASSCSASGTTTLTFTISGPGPVFQCPATLTATATSTVISGTVPTNAVINFVFTQGSGPYTVATPTGFNSWAQPVQVNAIISSFTYVTTNAGTAWNSVNGSNANYSQCPTSSVPGSPVTGYLYFWCTTSGLQSQNASGNQFTQILTSGDVNPLTNVVSKINTGTVPTNANGLSTNGSAQPVAQTSHNVSVIATCSGSASATAATCTTSPTFTPASGDMVLFTPGATNTGSFTLNVNSSSAVSVFHEGAALAGCELQNGVPVWLTYNGTDWLMPNGSVLIASGTTAASGAGSLNNLGAITSTSTATLAISSSCVVSTDTITATPNASLKAVTGFTPTTTGGISIVPYPSSGNVNFDAENWSTGSLTIGTGAQLNWRVTR